MKKINLLGYLSMALILLFTSCDQQGEMEILESSNSSIQIDKSKQIILQPTTLTKSEISEASCGESKVVTLTAGQHIDVGTITVSNDETNLYVIYETTGNWVITETHLYVGPEAGIPLNNSGNPRIGHFPYHGVDDEPFTIPLADLGDDFVIVAHAVVDKVINGQTVQSETAFGCGEFTFPGNRWGCYFDYEKQECEEEECIIVFGRKEGGNQTECLNSSLGWSSWFFYYYIDEQTNGWRGYSQINLYANVLDNCDLTNAIEVGRIEVRTVSGGLSFTYVLNEGYSLDEISLYVGDHVFNSNNDTLYNIDSENSVFVSWANDPSSQVFVTALAKVCQDGD